MPSGKILLSALRVKRNGSYLNKLDIWELGIFCQFCHHIIHLSTLWSPRGRKMDYQKLAEIKMATVRHPKCWDTFPHHTVNVTMSKKFRTPKCLTKWICKQCRPRSDCSWRRHLIRINTVCHFTKYFKKRLLKKQNLGKDCGFNYCIRQYIILKKEKVFSDYHLAWQSVTAGKELGHCNDRPGL